MKIFGICFWHSWKKWEEHYSPDICIWSSGFVSFRECKCCQLKESKRNSPGFEWEPVFDPNKISSKD